MLWLATLASAAPPAGVDVHDPVLWADRFDHSLRQPLPGCWQVRGTYQERTSTYASGGPLRPAQRQQEVSDVVPFTGTFHDGWSDLRPVGPLPEGVELRTPTYGRIAREASGAGHGLVVANQVETAVAEWDADTSSVRFTGTLEANLGLDVDEGEDVPVKISDLALITRGRFPDGTPLATEIELQLERPVKFRLGALRVARLRRAAWTFTGRAEGENLLPVRETQQIEIVVLGLTMIEVREYTFDDVTRCTSAPEP